MDRNLALSRDLLTQATETFETDHRRRGVFLIGAADLAYDAARLFCLDHLATRVRLLLDRLTPDDRWRGVISSFSPDQLRRHAHKARALEIVEQEHRLMSDAYAGEVVTFYAKHLAACLAGDYSALAAANSELERLDLAVTQAIVGDTDLAIAALPTLTESERRSNLILTLLIELYRRGRFDEGNALRAAHGAEVTDEWELVFLALGVSNRVPWLGYPYPDY